MARILIADDEESMRQLVARAIAMDGHETATAPVSYTHLTLPTILRV